MNFQYIIFHVVLASLCSFNAGLSTRRKEHATNVETLREAVNNAFDALTQVHEAIAKLDDSSNDDFDSTYNEDVGMDKDTAEKFVEEIDQLEDMIINKENDNEFVESRKEMDEKKDENGSKAMQLPAKRIETHTLESIDSDEFNDEDIEQSVDFLVDVLKEGLQHEKRESKIKDYLISIFEKETRELKKENGAISSLDNAKEKKSKNEKQNDEVNAVTTETSNANLSLKELVTCDGGCAKKKEIKKSEVVLRSSAKSDTKSESVKKETAINKKSNLNVDTKLSDNTSGEKTKKHAKAVKKHSSTGSEFDNEIRDLVNVILKRKEELKRKKLKLAVADMFQIMENKEEGYNQRKDDAGKEMRKYERMLMEN